ncbi:MAG: alpha hydrolase [Methanosarcinaceae archaeon]|jgi:predicted subunit of tRNA(5-methylaminomethyl-2-thiouridylate) methyltransferase|nr:alpha hydrolase [Methanosarcinaceae archaeon]NKQ38126.1 alpha hydrolase [Methanosarcinales archaeon]
MKAFVLFSGGKDSSLSAILTEPFFESVELVTICFSILDVGAIAKSVAKKIGFAHTVLNLDEKILRNALEIIINTGHPENAINYIHQNAIEVLACKLSFENTNGMIVDGIRRDDRVPKITYSTIKSIEARHNICHTSPLKGYGRKAVDDLVNQHFIIEENESNILKKADYETELRELIRIEYGAEKIQEIFSAHTQSRVIKRIR